MKIYIILITTVLLFISCSKSENKEKIRNEILLTEKAFEKMAAEKSISEAFYHYAHDSAVILRENDTLIKGKENIRAYYRKMDNKGAVVNWAPDHIDVSSSGDLAYTYGWYIWKIKNENGDTTEYKGIFHTVWKRQKDQSWRYVWD